MGGGGSLVGSVLHTKGSAVTLGCSTAVTCGALQAASILCNPFSSSKSLGFHFCKFLFLLPSLDLRILDFEDVVPSKYVLSHPADG